MASTDIQAKLELLNAILASPIVDKTKLLEGHRQKQLVLGINSPGFVNGLKWSFADDKHGFMLSTAIAGITGGNLDYTSGDKVIDQFPKALAPYLEHGAASGGYTQLFCKKSVPLSLLKNILAPRPVMGVALSGEAVESTDDAIPTVNIVHFFDASGSQMTFFGTASSGASAVSPASTKDAAPTKPSDTDKPGRGCPVM